MGVFAKRDRDRAGHPLAGVCVNRWVVFACGTILLAIGPGAPCTGAPAGEDDSVLARIRAAAISVSSDLRTGIAEGTFQQWGRKNELTHRAQFWGAFDGDKQYLRLEYQPVRAGSAPRPRKRIAVCDGSEAFISRFSKHIHPVGAEGDVHNDRPGTLPNNTDGFPGRIKGIVEGIISPDLVDKYEMTIEKLPNGHYRARYDENPETYTTLEIAPEYGYLVIGSETFYRDEPWAKFATTWEQVGDRWYAKTRRRETYGTFAKVYEVRFEDFQPNVPVSGKLFTLNALELPGGARILDRRPTRGAKEFTAKIYRLPDDGALAQKRADRMIEQVESLPQSHPTKKVKMESRWGRRLWAFGLSVLGIVAIAVVWLLRSRTRA